jgi:hypothetical protein
MTIMPDTALTVLPSNINPTIAPLAPPAQSAGRVDDSSTTAWTLWHDTKSFLKGLMLLSQMSFVLYIGIIFIADPEDIKNSLEIPSSTDANTIAIVIRMAGLGAFGNLFFLMMRYVLGQPLFFRDLVFRPSLSALLAVALYVISYAATAVLTESNSAITMQPAALYMLGLAAGLLSEKTYSLIVDKLGGELDKKREQEAQKSEKPAASRDNPSSETERDSAADVQPTDASTGGTSPHGKTPTLASATAN